MPWPSFAGYASGRRGGSLGSCHSAPAHRPAGPNHDTGLRRRDRGPGGDGQRGGLSLRRPRRARAGPRPLRSPSRSGLVSRRHAHHPRGLLRRPSLRADGPARVPPVARSRAIERRDAAGRDRRPHDRARAGNAGARRQGQRGHAPSALRAARGEGRSRAVSGPRPARSHGGHLGAARRGVVPREMRARPSHRRGRERRSAPRRRAGALVARRRRGIRGGDGARPLPAARLVLAANAWLERLLPDLPLGLTVTRQPLFWFEPRAHADDFGPERLPIYIWEPEPDRFFYGFPAFAGQVKVAPHLGGEPCDPDSVDREIREPEVEAMRRRLAPSLPDANGRFARAVVCMYANTFDGHFIIDRHPAHDRVLVISACSGHGFKFSSTIGEIAADLLLAGTSSFDLRLFSLQRKGLPCTDSIT